MASQADRVTCGDLDADGKDDLIGIWPTQGGVWVKYSKSGTWAKLSSTARDIAAGAMRPQMVPGPAAVTPGEVMNDAGQGLEELPMPMGGSGEGPEIASSKRDLSDRGPGGSRFLYIQDLHLDPDEDPADALARIPGPGEAGFIAEEQKYIFPADSAGSVKEPQRDLMNAIKPAPKRVQKHPE
jgi:hypothetical protein